MTDPISPLPQAAPQTERPGTSRAGAATVRAASAPVAASVPSAAGVPTGQAAAKAAPQNEAVTLSAAAQTTTQLLNAARDATGVNTEAVSQLRAAIAGGTYNVPPAALAQAISAGLKETQG
ncbi:MAG: flagellar biosynthesis anti-sigma factor FlgM [Rhodospirillales bacterium 20-64-7]|nr:MAG: flagellar biosynthesis anti-sigma factor FlgM [Rhodospirillales bacterium 20-64-7]